MDIKQYLNSTYAISVRNYAIEMFDLYTNNHNILLKKNKEVGGKTFRTTKIPLNFYQLIVSFIVDFVLGQPVTVSHPDEDFQELVKDFHKVNNIQTHNRKLLEHMCVFGQAFEHFFIDENGKPRLRLIDGMAAIPYYDDYMDLEMFIEDFKIKEADGSEKHYARLFTDRETVEYVGEKENFFSEERTENLFGLPIAGYKNKEFHRTVISDIEIIRPVIEEIERLLSDFGDILKYHSDPILVAFGQKLPDMGAGVGKILNFEKGADVKYLTWDQNVQAIDWYYQQLKNLLFELTLTPKILINPSTVSNLSGVALRIMYTPALIKANAKELALKEGMLKRYQLLARYYKALTGKEVNLSELQISFARSVPANESELLNNVLMLYNSGLISKETALQLAPYIENPQEELKKLEEENTDIYEQQFQQEAGGIE